MDEVQHTCVMELHVRHPNMLFEALDASPLGRRHLGHEVEQFIVHRAQEMRSPAYALTVHYPSGIGPVDEAAVSGAIKQHFSHRAQEESRELSDRAGEARRDLLIGLLFLLSCTVLALAASKLLSASLGLFVEQGLLVIGWVALWRPVDLFLYELRPMRTRRSLFEALSYMEVHFYSTP